MVAIVASTTRYCAQRATIIVVEIIGIVVDVIGDIAVLLFVAVTVTALRPALVVLLILLLPLVLASTEFREYAVIVIRVLQIIFAQHAIALLLRIARQIRVFLQQLVGVTALPRLHPVAVTPALLWALAAATATPTRLRIPHETFFFLDISKCDTRAVDCSRARHGPTKTAKQCAYRKFSSGGM
jgi:hypothetical protein